MLISDPDKAVRVIRAQREIPVYREIKITKNHSPEHEGKKIRQKAEINS
jgi:hypothetical protein